MFQFYASCEPLLPRLESLTLHGITEDLAPFIPLFLSPRTTSILFSGPGESAPEPVILPAVAALLVLCPNLQRFGLHHMPRDPVATDAVLKMLLNINQNILQVFDAGSPLTNEAKEFICKLPGLRELRIDIGESGSLPTLILPNLTKMDVCYDRDPGWLHAFRGAELGKLVSITLYCRSNPVNGISDVFESVALSTSIHTTLTRFQFRASHPHSWRPNYRSLLQFTQLKKLVVDFTCHRSQQADCSSTIGDDIITDFARAMPKLELLIFREGHASNGVTIKGLVALACYCPHLSLLSIHFQAASLELDPSEIPWATPGSRSSMPRGNCALTSLVVGDIPLAEGSVPAVTQTLLRIFPNLTAITNPFSWSWRKVAKLVRDSKPFADRSGEKTHSARHQVRLMSLSGSTLGNTVWL